MKTIMLCGCLYPFEDNAILEKVAEEKQLNIVLFIPKEFVQPVGNFIHSTNISIEFFKWDDNDQNILDSLLMLHKKYRLDGIVPNIERLFSVNGKFIEKAGFIGPSLSAIEFGIDKYKLRKVLNESGANPVFAKICTNITEVKNVFRKLNGSMIMKPNFGMGSIEIHQINKENDIEEYYTSIMKSGLSNGGVLCEEFLKGKEISVEGFSFNKEVTIVTLTDKLIDEEFQEIGHTQPAIISKEEYKQIYDLVEKIINIIDYKMGLFHLELKLTSHGPAVVEINTRWGGDQIYRLVEYTTGNNLISIAFDLAMNIKPIVIKNGIDKYAAVRFVKGVHGNTINKIKLPKEIIDNKEYQIYYYYKIGDTIDKNLPNHGRVLSIINLSTIKLAIDKIIKNVVIA